MPHHMYVMCGEVSVRAVGSEHSELLLRWEKTKGLRSPFGRMSLWDTLL
jgi:hypothetical protein